MSARPLLPLEIGILLLSISSLVRTSFGKIADENATCVGKLAALNSRNGDSPCVAYQSLQAPCTNGQSTACVCNAVAYNLASACMLCGNSTAESWQQWASDSDCQPGFVPPVPNYSIPSEENIPQWAFTTLDADAGFDVNAAIHTATQTKWTTLQIVLPIVSATAALLLAALAFWCWRRSKTRPKRRPYWQDANLQGPRRFFGLFADVSTVRKETVDTLWEIDHARGNGAVPPNGVYDAAEAGHSRTTSLSSLLPMSSHTASTHSDASSSSKSGLSNFLSHFTWSNHSGSLGKAKYKKGVAKAKEYKKVNVKPKKQSADLNLDADPEVGVPSRPASGPITDHGSRAPTLPSVIDIRMGRSETPSDLATVDGENLRRDRRTFGRPRVHYGVVAEEDFESAQFSRPPRSEFTLTTNDLMTPTDTEFPEDRLGNATLRPPSPSMVSAAADSDVLPIAMPKYLKPNRR